MRFHFQQALRAVILMMFTIFLVTLHQSGEIEKYINPKYDSLSKMGALLFFVLFLSQLFRIWSSAKQKSHHHHDHHHHDHGDGTINMRKIIAYLIICLPLLTGTLLPTTTLDASIAEKKGMMLSLTNQANNNMEEGNENSSGTASNQNASPNYHEIDPNVYSNTITSEAYDSLIEELKDTSKITMSDTLYATYYNEINKDIQRFQGKEITLKGFVYRENDFSQNQLVIARFLITHCIADAGVIGFLSEFEEAISLPEDTWIEIKAEISIGNYKGKELPVLIVKEWKEIGSPAQPYVYPISIKYA
ncbi:TIGR03943 family protein [Virgibacillus dakarensis]|uniref:UPF0703 protein YcgQ n=1 Tax=Lentibacillus populi TaxID=1827502 RepID=A0A9W5U2L4_9BACI|nr:TIGR03943 family protein [Lentibacillus populi]MTW85255.1 TIGR03943 family protein [Virgibacillus dakarensis]GGB62502.1 UPF0703 protein YcgQ [Lentibacillus populi]